MPRNSDLDAAVANTPPGRDRWADAIRVGSLFVVIIGHWLMGALTADGQVTNTLATMTWLQPITWVLQVMPLFFLVGGVAHAHTLARLDATAGPGAYATFARSRTLRLMRPTSAFLAVWIVIAVVAHLLGWTSGGDGPLVRTVLVLVPQLLWFVGIYLGVAALAPLMRRLHHRYGVAVAWALVAAVVIVDWLRFAQGHEAIGPLNFLLVWLALHQLGFAWHDGALTSRLAGALLALGTLGLVACVTLGPYPVSMVGLPGEPISNMSPPTLALLAQGLAIIGATSLLRGPAARALARPRVWRVVLLAAPFAMTAFLWHLTALMVGLMGARSLHLRLPEPGTGMWWLTRPLWFAALGVLTAGLVTVFVRFDRGASAPRVDLAGSGLAGGGPADARAAVGIALVVAGVICISLTGVDVLGNRPQTVLFFQVTPGVALAVTILGAAVLGLLPVRHTAKDPA